tara:strand:+ start:212 stop:517 length:306 start_codon:yes stop_codon:yes gene_type:complete
MDCGLLKIFKACFRCSKFFQPMRKNTPRITQQTAELMRPENTKTVIMTEIRMEPSAVENKNASPGPENFSLLVRTWPELWKARIIRRKNVKSISRNSKIQF